MSYTITTTLQGTYVEGGTVTINGDDAVGEVTVAEHSDVTLVLTPREGYKVEKVSIDGVEYGEVASIDIDDITEDHTIGVWFVLTSSFMMNGGLPSPLSHLRFRQAPVHHKGGHMHEAYEEYKKENPDELVGLNEVFIRSIRIDAQRKIRQAEKLKLIEECKRRLNEHSE